MKYLIVILLFAMLCGCCGSRGNNFYVKYVLISREETHCIYESVPKDNDRLVVKFESYIEAREECDRLNGLSRDESEGESHG